MRFTIEARGEGLTYQWQVSTNGGVAYGDSTAGGNKTASMTVPLQDQNPGYLYRCKVTDANGNVVYSKPGMIRNGQISWDFTYDANGLRTKRTNGTTTYDYIYNGSQLTKMTVGGHTLNFAYDVDGKPAYLVYDGTKYFYMTNLQGDVVAIADRNGNVLVQYTYDAWGNILTTTGSMATTLGKYNPLRYRGYVYDQESALYYLQSRYYDPALGRFINSDILVSTGQGLLGNNPFIYCGNNPVIRTDRSGNAWETVWDVLSLVSSAAEVVANPTDPWAWAGLIGDIVDVALPGIGGLGEAVDAAKSAYRVVDQGDDIIDAAKQMYRMADTADSIKDAKGAYVVLYEGGQHYIGKGGFQRAITSATEHMSDTNKVSAIIWAPTSSDKSAFIAEYLLQSAIPSTRQANNSFNKIWSPGRKMFQALQ